MAKRKKPNEDQTDNSENINESDDNFGLPEIEYEPLNRETKTEETFTHTSSTSTEETTEATEEPVSESTEYRPESAEERSHEYVFDDSEERSSAPKIIGIIIALIVVVGAVWYFMMYQPKRKEIEERARQEELVRQEAARKIEADRVAELQRQEREKRIADSLANAVPKEGAIETLSGRTGLYYVVVSSDIDDDLIMDYAKKLSKKGIGSKIIPPHGKIKFFRLAISEAGSYSDAQAKADGLKGEYADGTWVVKY
jgi:hypothetical protein